MMSKVFLSERLSNLRVGDYVYLEGIVYTIRDASAKKIVSSKEDISFLKGSTIYFCGPCVDKSFRVISAGPTTSSRMEKFFSFFIQKGVRAFIGKGELSKETYNLFKKKGIIYFGAMGGIGALLAKKIKASHIVLFPELGPEAIFQMDIENFPVKVLCAPKGNTFV